jgi:hypothetical protein
LLGDLRLIRHDIRLQRERREGGCIGEFALIRWFEEGDPVDVRREQVAEFMGL